MEALEQKNAPRVAQWLQDSTQGLTSSPDLGLLREYALRAGWNEFDAARLVPLGYHYACDPAKALSHAEALLANKGFAPDLFEIAIISLYHLGRFEDAYERLANLGDRKELFTTSSSFLINAALICLAVDRIHEARNYIDIAWSLAPNDALIALNAYTIYFDIGDMDAFEQVNSAFQQGRYDLELTGTTLAVVELAQDHYARGFRLLEHRYTKEEVKHFLNPCLFAFPRWQGESLDKKALLISAEQGLGDTIQMARFLPEIASNQQCGRLTVEAQPEALTLLRFNFPQIDIVALEWGNAPLPKFDRWTGMMSLPHRLGITEKTVPGRQGYLAVPQDNTDYWQARVAELSRAGRPRIGLAWSGRPTHRADRRRSIPFARMMEAIRLVDADFFALQTQVPILHPANLIDVSEEMVTLADTAALIAEMDLVITVDTSVVHLAGAIGHQTWLLLPYRYEWRWGLDGETNRWYDSVRVLRQNTHGDWEGLLSEVFQYRLPKFLEGRSYHPSEVT